MHGIDLTKPVHFYTDASGFAGGIAITQYQDPRTVETYGNALVEVPIIYDSFTFTPTRRRYPTYKRELYVLVEFARKYSYLCKNPHQTTIIHTDHKPLIYFLKSDSHEEIYGNWADQLRRLNIEIRYISGARNKVADALSRTLFDEGCTETRPVAEAFGKLTQHGPQWIWKDGKDGYEAFLKSLQNAEREEAIEHGTIKGTSVFSLVATASTKTVPSWNEAYLRSEWFGDVYALLSYQSEGTPSAALLRKAFHYRKQGEILWIHRNNSGTYLPCIPEGKVLSILIEAHDQNGHWAKTGTMARLRNLCYWPGQSNDVERYIEGCLACAQHGPATRSQPLHPVVVTYPFQLMGMDFIGPLKTTTAGNKYILNLGCYMSRFNVPFACKNANVGDVIQCLKLFFVIYRKPYAFYLDSGLHFDCEELRDFLHEQGIAVDYSPSASHKSTGLIEVMNKILEGVIRKLDKEWDVGLADAACAINSRIISYLDASPKGIVLGPLPETSSITATLRALPGRDIREWVAKLEASHRQEVLTYLRHRAEVHDAVNAASQLQKEDMAARYNKGIKQTTHHIKDLVMLHQERSGKLQPRWRGPFQISEYAGSHGLSSKLQQLNGRPIRGSFHGDHLKRFVPRSGYLASHDDIQLLQTQTIRAPRRPKQHARVRLHLRPPKPPIPSPNQDARTVSPPP